MEIPDNLPILAVNNSFFKLFKIISEKHRKYESITKEIEWINEQLICENRRKCETSKFLLVHLVRSAVIEFGHALNYIISALPRVPAANNDIIADGLFQLLLLEVEKSKADYKCPFGIIQKPHPALLLLENTSDKMLYLSKKIQVLLESRDK